MNNYQERVKALHDEMIAMRRDFHQHPELAFQEVRTAGIVAKTLTDLGLEVQAGVGKTGVVALLEGAEDGPTVLVRADMDALPIHEATGAEYLSRSEGVMHACGHDGHTAIGLTVARLLAEDREQIKGRVKFVFQPAEEIGQGARAMIADGALDGPRPDLTLGLHLWSSLEVGQIGVSSGPFMAAADIFSVLITGSGGHGAVPNETRDPILAAAQIVTALQSIVSRNVDPLDTAVVTVGSIQGGDAFNVIPQTVTLKGTIRTYTKETKTLVHERLAVLCDSIAKGMGCEAELEIKQMTIAVDNHAETSQRVRETLRGVVGAENLHSDLRTMGAEDVSYFMDDIPGCYFLVGAGNKARDMAYPHHHPKFDIDEDSLVVGATALAEAVAGYVIRE
jgi:amidohydrolase